MFDILADEKSLLAVMTGYTEKELKIACSNIQQVIELLSASAADLINNRRQFGVLLPQEDSVAVCGQSEEGLKIEAVLQQQHLFIAVINRFNLTEATFVRNNLNECLALVLEDHLELAKEMKTTSIQEMEESNVSTANNVISEVRETSDITVTNRKSNVAPIRLNEIKQRLAQAEKEQDEKQKAIKNRLNQLIMPEITADSASKLA